jgi:peptidoglycan/LPS O-acetylase OafA/YrhL
MRAAGAAVQGALMRDAAHDRALDGLRGISAAVVVIAHAASGVLGQLYPAAALLGGWLARLAVIVFFVLSGYVIVMSVRRMMDSGGFSMRQFAINRVARIYPPFLLSLLLVWTIAMLTTREFMVPDPAFPARDFTVGPFVFLRDAIFLFGNGTPAQMINGPIWSLRLEVACYILTALCVLSLERPARIQAVWLGLAFAFATATFIRLEGAWLAFLAFSAGGAAAIWPIQVARLPTVGLTVAAIAAGALAFGLTGASHGKFEPHWSYSLFQIMAVLMAVSLAVKSAEGPRPGQQLAARFHWLADASYTVFITHYPVMIAVAAFWPKPDGIGSRCLMIIVLVATAFLFAVPAARIVEQQTVFRGWLDRLIPSRALPVTGAGA